MQIPKNTRNQTNRFASWRSVVRYALPCLLLLGAGAVRGNGGTRPAPPDANALVRKMVVMYKKADTVQTSFEATIQQMGASEYIQSGNMKYRRPDAIQLSTSDPLTGSFLAIANGPTVTVYGGKNNVYTRRSTQGGLAANLGQIEKASQNVLTDANGRPSKSTQLLSPLSFMLAKDMPREVKTFSYAGQDNVRGRKAFRVRGSMDADFVKNLLGSSSVTVEQRDVTLWIDVANSQLLRSSSTLSWKYQIKQGGKTRTVVGGIAYTETYSGTSINAPINSNDFQFRPPQGAKQLFQEVR